MFLKFVFLKKTCSDKKYHHVLKVWNEFEIKTKKDSHNLYLKWYVLLLGGAFKKFRNNSLKNYGLRPALSWDAIVNMTKVELELTSDPDVYIFFEKGMRGGVSCISNST